MNQVELAKSFGVSRITVQAWDKEGLAVAARVSEKPVAYDGVKAWEWRWANKLPQAPASQKEAKARKLAAEAAIKELELAERRGELIHVDVFRKLVGEVFGRVRAKLVALKGSLPPRLTGLESPRDAQAVLGPGIDEAIAELAEAATSEEAAA